MRSLSSLLAVASVSTTFLAAGLAPADVAAARAVTQEYRDAWLANDPARVMATLTPDAVLLPSSMAPIAGEAAIRRFWWPQDAPPTTVTAMDLVIDEVDGSGDVAIVRGSGTLTFRTGGASAPTTSLQHTFLNVVRRQTDGRSLITRCMWSDLR